MKNFYILLIGIFPALLSAQSNNNTVSYKHNFKLNLSSHNRDLLFKPYLNHTLGKAIGLAYEKRITSRKTFGIGLHAYYYNLKPSGNSNYQTFSLYTDFTYHYYLLQWNKKSSFNGFYLGGGASTGFSSYKPLDPSGIQKKYLGFGPIVTTGIQTSFLKSFTAEFNLSLLTINLKDLGEPFKQRNNFINGNLQFRPLLKIGYRF